MSQLQQHVRVVSPLLAVRSDFHDGKSRFVELGAGSVISTPAAYDQPGLLVVTRGTEELLVFARDLRERTEPVDGRSEALAEPFN